MLSNWEWFMLGFYVSEKIVKLTPPTFKIWKIPIGKYDDIVVDGAKTILTKLIGKK